MEVLSSEGVGGRVPAGVAVVSAAARCSPVISSLPAAGAGGGAPTRRLSSEKPPQPDRGHYRRAAAAEAAPARDLTTEMTGTRAR